MTEWDIKTTISWLKICIDRQVLIPTPGLMLSMGTSAESEAWRKMALDYLIARKKGVTFAQFQHSQREAEYDS